MGKCNNCKHELTEQDFDNDNITYEQPFGVIVHKRCKEDNNNA